jgi:hypothetical protein
LPTTWSICVLAASGQVNGRAVTVAEGGNDDSDAPRVVKLPALAELAATARAELSTDMTMLLAFPALAVDATDTELALAKVSVTVVSAVILLVSVDAARTIIR